MKTPQIRTSHTTFPLKSVGSAKNALKIFSHIFIGKKLVHRKANKQKDHTISGVILPLLLHFFKDAKSGGVSICLAPLKLQYRCNVLLCSAET